MPVRQAAPSGSSKCHRRKLGSCCSDFHETRTMPMTTNNVPRMINSVVVSRKTTIAMVALISGLKRGAARGADLLHPRVGKKSNRKLKNSHDGKQQDALPWNRMHPSGQKN